MKHFLIEISEGDAKIQGKSIYEYATADEAEANFHGKLATAMKSEMYSKETLTVVREDGYQFQSLTKYYVRPVSEVVEAE